MKKTRREAMAAMFAIVATSRVALGGSERRVTGARGKVRLGPLLPVARQGSSNDEPLPGVIVMAQRRPGGTIFGRATSNAKGEFQMAITPGRYLFTAIRPDPPLPPNVLFVRLGSATLDQVVIVPRKGVATITFAFDTGIR